MANDKKFIVKNGLQTEENVVIGSSTDNGSDRLQVTGSAKVTGKAEITQSIQATPSIKVTNSGGPSAEIAEFAGASESIKIINDTAGDYRIVNTGQNNGIKFYDNGDGLEILYNNAVDMDFNATGIDFKREPTYNGSVFWNAGNDGAGSGLDADLIDGLDSLQFVRADQDDTLDGNYTITGNLTVQGTRTEIVSETVLIADNLLTLNSNFTTGTPTENAGWEVLRGDEANSSLQWDETNDWFKLISAGTDLGRIITTADEGAGNNFDADTVDGLEAAQFLRADADDTATGNITVEGNLTVGDGNGTAFLYMDGSGNNGTLASTLGEIGFLNSSFNYGLKLNTAGDVEVTDDILAQKFIDINDNTYEVVPSATSTLNHINLAGALRRNGDTTTLIEFPTASQIGFDIAGTQLGLMTPTSFQYNGDMIADKFIDRNDNAFFVDPDGTSELNSANFYSGTANNSVNIGTGAAQRFNIDVTANQGYIRYIQDDANATDNSVNFQILSPGFGLNRFNFNANIDAGANSITGGFGVFSLGAYASVYYDYENEAYFADFSNTGNSINIAGTIEGGNGTAAIPTYTFGSDTDTGMFRGAANRLDFTAGGNVELQVNTTYTSAPGSFRAPIFEDSDNTAYYGNFAGTSVMNRIELDDYIQHKGDTNNYFGFGANDTFRVWTNAVQRLNIDNDSADFSIDVFAPKFVDSADTDYFLLPSGDSQLNTVDIDDYIRHRGDLNTYVGFDATDQVGIWTNAVKRLNITNTAATFTNNAYAPAFFTDDYLIHNGNTNTYIGFDAADQFGVWTAGVKQIAVNATSVDINLDTNVTGALDVTGRSTLGNSLTRPDDLSDLSDSAARIGGSDVHLHIASLAAAGDYAVALQSGRESDDASFPLALQPNGGNVGVGTTSAGATLTINKTTVQGNNPFVSGTSLLSLGDMGTVDLSIRTDAAGNIYYINDNGGDQVWYDTGASGKFAILSNGVVAGDAQFTTGTPTVTTNFITTPAANAFHSVGGISIEGKNSLLSIYQADGADAAVNEATFLGVNELGFSAGGGFYMDDTTTIKTRGNKDILTTGNISAGRFVDGNNDAYYADPASTSIFNRIDLDDYIRHNGDTNTYFGFSAADTFKIFTGNTQQVNIDNDSANFAQNVYAPKYYDSADNDYLVHPSGTSVLGTIELDDYIQHKDNTDAYFGFAGNNNYKLFTNGVERFNVDANSADFSVNVYAPRYYDSADSSYFLDPADKSYVNNMSFGIPASVSTKGRFLSIEGNATAAGEASGRIFFAENNASAATQDRYGMSLAYRGGNAAINSVTGQPVTLSGVSDGQWALIGHNNSVNGNWAMRGPRDSTYVEARVAFRAPRFEDSSDSAYYADPASTSVMNVVRANQFQLDGSTYTIDSPSGDVGSIKVDGALGGYAGYMIRDDWGFISDGTTTAGIYNDTRNEWALKATDNNRTEIFANGVAQLSAENGYGSATNSFRSPIYYPPSGTTRFLDLDVTNGNQALKIGGEIFREGFAADDGADNKFLTAQDQNQWIWNTSSNWGITWATNTTSAYRHTQFGDNMISFVGAGNVRAAIDLDNGDAFFEGEVGAGNFALSAGGENISLNPQYGSGLADTTLFDGTQYWEKRNTAPLQGNESNNILTSEYVKNGDGPFSSSYVVRTDQYRTFNSDMISVEPGEEIYGEIWTRVISGSGGRTYYGIERFDKDKKPIAGNSGTSYFVAGGQVTTDTNWQKFSSYHTIPTSHTAFDGSDGAGVKYVRIRILMNHSTGGALREYGPPILKRVDVQSKLYTSEGLYVGTDATIVGDLSVDDITADLVDANSFRDASNTTRYIQPAVGASVAGTWNWNNGEITGLDKLKFADPGPNEGIEWVGGSGWKIYESPDDLTTNSGGNLQIVQGTTSRAKFNTSGDIIAGRYMDATRFRDSNNAAYYLDPASTSVLNEIRADEYIRHNGDTDTYIRFTNADDMQLVAGGRQMLRMAEGTNPDRLRFVTDDNWTDANGDWAMSRNVVVTGTHTALNGAYASRFYDSDDNAFYLDPASTSITNVISANMFSTNNGWDIFDNNAETLSIRSNNGDHGYIVFRDSGDTDCGRIEFDDDGFFGFKTPANEWGIQIENNARVINYYDGTWEQRTGLNHVEARVSYRAPLFEDSNDTTFYANPASTSRFRGLTTLDVITTPGVTGNSGSLRRKDNREISPSEDISGEMNFGFTSWNNNNTAPYADYLHLRSYTDASGGSDNLLMFKKSGRGMRLWQQSFNSGTAYSGYSDLAIYNANPGAGSDFYASIFYDADDSNYKLDLTSTSNSAQRIRGGSLHGPNATWGKYLLVGGDGRNGYVNNTDVASISTTDGNLHADAASGKSLYLNYYDGDRTYFGNGAGAISAEVKSNGYFSSPRYLDRNDEAYYGDFAATSIMSVLDIRSEIYNDGWFRNDTNGRGLYSTPNGMHFASTGNNRWVAHSNQTTSRIDLGTAGNVRRGAFYANNSNEIGILSQDDGWALQVTNSKTDSHHNFYAPIMYDRDDSNYYVNPASQSHMNTLTLAGNRIGFVNSSFDAEIRVTDSNPDGTGSTFTFWGDGVEYNAEVASEVFRATRHMRAGRYYDIDNATFFVEPASTSYFNNVQADIVYDRNDTAYYFNGASVNSTRFEGVSARTKAQIGLSGQTRSSAETFMRRPNYTTDTNYWTGAMGWGTQDMNTVGNWGSGFIDSWSNPANQPSGTSHWVGTQAFHYSNGSARYGWQLVGGPIDNLRFRSSWSGFKAWRTVPVLGVNNGNAAAMYASSFIDADNTGFYCNPSTGTNLNGDLRATEIYARNWFRNDNAQEGIYNQATGVHAYSWQNQYYAITGNNNNSTMSLQLRAASNGTMCRWMYGDRTWSGDLNAAGQWQLQTRHQDGYSPSMRFVESGNESWTGNVGNDAGKIEYHSNRFYIEAGGNSNRICQFRRNGSDRSYVDNNGLYVGTATSARWADLAERYTADAIYENATVLGVNLDGDSEATLWQPGMPLLGVISTNPAVQMNDMGIEPGSTSKKAKMNPFVALKGRIPCLVNGDVKKGQWVIPCGNGKAKGVDYGTPGINSYEIIGIALSDSENGEVEVKV